MTNESAEPSEAGERENSYRSAPSTDGAERASEGVLVTGLVVVDQLLAREPEIRDLPVTERAAAHEQVHRDLEHVLEQYPGALPPGLTGQ